MYGSVLYFCNLYTYAKIHKFFIKHLVMPIQNDCSNLLYINYYNHPLKPKNQANNKKYIMNTVLSAQCWLLGKNFEPNIFSSQNLQIDILVTAIHCWIENVCMNCCTKFQLCYISDWSSTIYSLAGLLALRDTENIYWDV